MINLNQLLDEDCLTPEQERSVRKAIHYYIKNDGDELVLYFNRPNSQVQQIYYLRENINLAYKQVMYYLISFHKFKGNLQLSKEVKSLQESNGINYMHHMPINMKCQDLYDLLERVRAEAEVSRSINFNLLKWAKGFIK